MDYQEAKNNVECRFLNVGRQLFYLEEYEAFKKRDQDNMKKIASLEAIILGLQRLGRIEDSVKMGVSYGEKTKS